MKKVIPEDVLRILISNQETQKLVDEMSMKTYGFQANWYKDIDGGQGVKWNLAMCGGDCGAGPGCAGCPGLRAMKGSGYKVCHFTGDLLLPTIFGERRSIFVCPMGDLFHPNIPDWFIACVFAVIANTPEHVYIILTKRSKRMAKLLTSLRFDLMVYEAGLEIFQERHLSIGPEAWGSRCIVGVSVESQAQLDRALVLCDLPSYLTTSIHASPLIGELNLTDRIARHTDWLVTTKEIGIGGFTPRECKPEWKMGLNEQCNDYGIRFFVGDKLSRSLKEKMGGYRPRGLPDLLLKG
jgi:protein gp37